MATKKEIMRQLLKGVSWNEAARSLGCSKATVGTVKILAHFPTAPRPAVRCGYSSSSVTSR